MTVHVAHEEPGEVRSDGTRNDRANPPRKSGRYGPPIGWLEHEVDEWVRSRTRAATGSRVLPPQPPPAHPVILRDREVEQRTGLNRVQRWRLEQKGKFPRRVHLDSAV
jgi:predicted DNA-binding transcriptional regulator AlpA